jgi:hypothetical protein
MCTAAAAAAAAAASPLPSTMCQKAESAPSSPVVASLPPPPSCEACDDDVGTHPATHRCDECSEFMCLLLANSHRVAKKTKTHRLIELPTGRFSPGGLGGASASSSGGVVADNVPLCEKHRKPFEFFDRQCRQLLCVNCGFIEHRGHVMVEVADEAAICHAQIDAWLLEARQYCERAQMTEALVASTRAAVHAARGREAQAVLAFCGHLRTAVNESQAGWLARLDTLAASKVAALTEQGIRLQALALALRAAIQQGEAVRSAAAEGGGQSPLPSSVVIARDTLQTQLLSVGAVEAVRKALAGATASSAESEASIDATDHELQPGQESTPTFTTASSAASSSAFRHVGSPGTLSSSSSSAASSSAAAASAPAQSLWSEPLAADAALSFWGALEATLATIRSAGAVLLPPAPDCCEASGDGLRTSLLGVPVTVHVVARDADHQPVSNLPVSAISVVLDEGDESQQHGIIPDIVAVDSVQRPGCFQASFTWVNAGSHRVAVRINGSDVPGSPWTVLVQPPRDISWMLTTDAAGGFRRMTGSRLALAVSSSPMWDESKVYDVPEGFHWATTAEVLAEAARCPNEAAYASQAGWTGYTWQGQDRHGFVCCDSLATGTVQHAGHSFQTNPMQGILSHARNNRFAGLVCIQDS